MQPETQNCEIQSQLTFFFSTKTRKTQGTFVWGPGYRVTPLTGVTGCTCASARAAISAFDGLHLLFGCGCGPNGLVLRLPLAGVWYCVCGSPISALMLLVFTPSCC